MTRAVQQLQRLHDEFDLANAAGPELDVPLQILVADDVALDPSLDRRDLIEQLRRCAFRIDERLMFAQEIVGKFFAAGDAARFDQREALPRFAEPAVVILEALRASARLDRPSLQDAVADPCGRVRPLDLSRRRFRRLWSRGD